MYECIHRHTMTCTWNNAQNDWVNAPYKTTLHSWSPRPEEHSHSKALLRASCPTMTFMTLLCAKPVSCSLQSLPTFHSISSGAHCTMLWSQLHCKYCMCFKWLFHTLPKLPQGIYNIQGHGICLTLVGVGRQSWWALLRTAGCTRHWKRPGQWQRCRGEQWSCLPPPDWTWRLGSSHASSDLDTDIHIYNSQDLGK